MTARRQMRLNRVQLQLLRRYPRSRRVWGQLGVRLANSTQVQVDPQGGVRVVRREQ